MKRIANLGMSYMGSKRKLAEPILNKILDDNPNTKYIYDLFGGGGAISFNAVQRKQIKQVFYNELNTGIVELLKDVVNNGITEKYYNFIDRKVFFDNKDKDTWLGGLCKIVWSFGNNQSSYIYGRHLEEDKYLLHDIVVNRRKKSLEKFNTKYNLRIYIPEWNIQKRKLNITKQIKKKLYNKKDIQYLGRIEHLDRINLLTRVQYLKDIKVNNKLIITNKSYEDVIIDTPIEETIIYLDPPYKNTEKYQEQIDYEKLFNWVKNNPYTIYLSSYEYNLACVKEFSHRSILSATANNEVREKLFCNKDIEPRIIPTLF